MRKALYILACFLGCGILLVARTDAGEVVSSLVIDGVTYRDIRWGPVNNGKITFFHNRGVQTGVPLEKLPAKYQRQFGHVPSASDRDESMAPPPLPPDHQADSAFARLQRQQAQQRYEAELARRRAVDAHRSKYAVIDDKVVPVSQLTRLVGFLQARAEVQIGQEKLTGYLLDLARLRNPERHIPAELLMRPGLWEKTGEQVFLKEFQTDELLGSLLELYGLETDPILEHRTFVIGTTPTAQQVRGRP